MIGQKLGQYEIVAEIGSGGMGTVYRGRQISLNRDVAIKVLHFQQAVDAAQLERFKREALLVAQVAHPNIIQIVDSGDEHGTHYIIMEYVEGRTVSGLLKEKGPMEFGEAVVIGSQVASGLGAVHAKGLIHRDVKPSNILVTSQQVAKLGDFGVALLANQSDDERLTMTRAAVGTPYYMSPEQIRGRDGLTGASDVYSLGVVLYEMLAGEHPFGGSTPSEAMIHHVHESFPPIRRYRSDIPDDLERILDRCLAKDPMDRFRDGDALHAALEKVRVRFEMTRLDDGTPAEDYRSRVTGTGFFYTDPNLQNRSSALSLFRHELLAQCLDPNRKKRGQVQSLLVQAQDARTRYKRLEKEFEELRKRKSYHDKKAKEQQTLVQSLIAAGQAEEANTAAEKESHYRQLAVDFEHQASRLGDEVKAQREMYDRLRDEQGALADELSLLDAEAQRSGKRIPSWHRDWKLANRVRWCRYGLMAAGLVLCLGIAGFLVQRLTPKEPMVPSPATYPPAPPVQPAPKPKPKPARTIPLKKKDIPAALKKGLVLYFPFDEGGDDVRDASGNKNVGKVQGARFEALEDRPSVYEFTGGSEQGQAIVVQHSDNLVSMEKTRQLTLSVWIKPRSLPAEFPVVLGKGGNWPPRAYGGYELVLNSHLDNDLTFYSDTGSTTTRNARGRWINQHLNKWIHVVVVVESPLNERSRCVFYVNGNRTGDQNSDEGFMNAAGSEPTINFGVTNLLYLGAPDPGHHPNRAWFDGWMDDVMIYNRALGADEVLALYQAQNYQDSTESASP